VFTWKLGITKSSAVARRPCNASCRWIFCCHSRHSKWNCWV